jgi:hypothetical protein
MLRKMQIIKLIKSSFQSDDRISRSDLLLRSGRAHWDEFNMAVFFSEKTWKDVVRDGFLTYVGDSGMADVSMDTSARRLFLPAYLVLGLCANEKCQRHFTSDFISAVLNMTERTVWNFGFESTKNVLFDGLVESLSHNQRKCVSEFILFVAETDEFLSDRATDAYLEYWIDQS